MEVSGVAEKIILVRALNLANSKLYILLASLDFKFYIGNTH